MEFSCRFSFLPRFLVLAPLALRSATRSSRHHHRRLFPYREVRDPHLEPRCEVGHLHFKTAPPKKHERRAHLDGPTVGVRTPPLTADGSSSSHARWSPGWQVSSLSSSARDEGKTQVWCVNHRLGGEADRLQPPRRGNFAWSPRQPPATL